MPIDLGQIIGQLFGAGKTRQKMDQWGNTTFEPVAPVADILFNRGQGRQRAMDLNLQPYLQQMELKKAQQLGDIETGNTIKTGKAADMRRYQMAKDLPPNEQGEKAYMNTMFGNDALAGASRSAAGLTQAQLGEVQAGEGLKQFYRQAPDLKQLSDLKLNIDVNDLREKLALAEDEARAKKSEIQARESVAKYLVGNPEAKYAINRMMTFKPGDVGYSPATGNTITPNPKPVNAFDRIINEKLGLKNTQTPGINPTSGGSGKPSVVQTLANGNIVLSTGQVVRPDGSVVE